MFTFDSANFEIPENEGAGTKFPALPDGNYNVVCVDASYETVEKGEYISLKWEVVDGEHNGQWVWDKVFVVGGYFEGHADKGQQDLARILKYSGLNAIKKDVFELVDAEVAIKTKQSPNSQNPDKPFVNVKFYNPKKKGGSNTEAVAKPATPAFTASAEDAPF